MNKNLKLVETILNTTIQSDQNKSHPPKRTITQSTMGKNDDFIPVAMPVPIYASTAPSSPSAPYAPSDPNSPIAPTAPPQQGLQTQQSSFFIATTHTSNNQLSQFQDNQLRSQGYTVGLRNEILLFTKTFSLRFWVVDNSGSMATADGNRFVNSKTGLKMVSCTRWKEIVETVEYHAQLAALLHCPTTFRLLNNPGGYVGSQEFSIGRAGAEMVDRDLQVARETLARSSPMGVTPLAKHVRDIREEIHALAPSLFQQGRKIAIILATDGLPTNEYGIAGREANDEFTTALRSLEGLPVWIVVRLCTDEANIVQFYNDIDAQLELSIEVLDDYVGEAQEVHSVNPWLNYTLVIHRMREMGVQNRLLDLLDERLFTTSEMYEFCVLLFGAREFENVPDPDADFAGFMKKLSKILDKEKSQWNPISKKTKPIIDVKEVARLYGNGSCVIM